MDGFPLVVRVDAAACHDDDIGAILYMEIIVNHIVDIAVGHAGGNIHGLPLGVGADVDINSLTILLWLDADIFR